MSSIDAHRKAEIAKKYVSSNIYPQYDQVELFEMKQTQNGTRIGTVAKRYGVVGKKSAYALLTVDDHGVVVVANGCSKEKLYSEFGYELPSLSEAYEEVEDDLKLVNELLFGKKSEFKRPSKCPECQKNKSVVELLGFRDQFKKLSEGVYQCRSCGNMIRLSGEDVHMHKYDG